jgi:hypothetical protein
MKRSKQTEFSQWITIANLVGVSAFVTYLFLI